MTPGFESPAPSPYLGSEFANKGSHKAHAVTAIIAVVCSLVVLLLMLLGFCCYKRSNARRINRSFLKANCRRSPGQSSGSYASDLEKSSAEYTNPSVSSMRVISTTPEVQVFTYKQLRFATNNFSSANVIGNGGFGLVYRSVLLDGRVTAIKQLDRDGQQGEREFRVEVDLLSRLHSPYLLQLIGYCADQDHRLLVYEYMSNGSVQEHLYSDGEFRLLIYTKGILCA